jgi:hypothetical protein
MEARDGLKLRGELITECYRWHEPGDKTKRFRNAKGQFERRLIWRDVTHNIWTNEGIDRILNTFYHGATQIATWYCGLVETDTAPAAAMNYDVPVFTESTSYDQATRPEYVEAASVAQSTTNSASKAAFTISATKTFYGAALFSISTKGNHAAGADNVLSNYARFAASRAAVDDDTVNLTYTITCADDGVA